MKNHVRADQPICQEWIFDWLYTGFGSEKEKIRSVILECEGEVVGFRGVIPALFQIPSESSGIEVVQGGVYAYWNILKSLRGKGFGRRMHDETLRISNVISSLGSKRQTSVPIYMKNGWSYLDSLNRYVRPLSGNQYLDLLGDNTGKGVAKDWIASLSDTIAGTPLECDAKAYESVWKATTFPLGIFAQCRTEEFWTWRYIKSPGFRYHFFGDPVESGGVVARAEVIYSDDRPDLQGSRVLRIIEVLPRNQEAWKGKDDAALGEVLKGCLGWGAENGCIAADFYCSHTRFDTVFASLGFRSQNQALGPAECSIPLWFQPLSYGATPINALFRIDLPRVGLISVRWEDVHMVKSENDQDRPNLCESNMLLDTEETYVFRDRV